MNTRKVTSKTPPTLQALVKRKLKLLGKTILEAVYANYSWHMAVTDWRAGIPVSEVIDVEGTDYCFTPLFTPEKLQFCGKEFLHVCCLDGHHIRTNNRAKICKDGTENLRKEAWLAVAQARKTPLSIAMLEVNRDGKILDQQCDKYVLSFRIQD